MKKEILSIIDSLLPNTRSRKVFYGNACLSMTNPSPDRLYIKILNVLKDRQSRSIDEIYGVIPGTRKALKKDGYVHNRWSSHSILGCLYYGGYIDRCSKNHRYSITEKGLNYLIAVGM